MSETALHRAHTEVQQLALVVGWLQASLRTGTAKPWQQPALTASRREQLDAQARVERRERVNVAPGESPAPYDLDVSDLLGDTVLAAWTLALDVAVAAELPSPGRRPSRLASPMPYLQLVEDHLRDVADDLEVLRVTTRTCAQLVRRGWVVLGLVYDGQLLDRLCPWCSGRSDTSPVGGDRTLRVRTSPGRRGDQGRPVVVCEGGACAPPEAHCGQRWRGLPAWDLLNEGDWLARCIATVNDTPTCPCGRPAFSSGRGRPATYCSEACRRAAERDRRRVKASAA